MRNDNVYIEAVVYVNLQEPFVVAVLRVFVIGDFVGIYPRFAKQHSQETFEGVLDRIVPQDVNVIELVLIAN